jgi:hypothetical protein
MMTDVASAHSQRIREARPRVFVATLLIAALPHVFFFSPLFYAFDFLVAWLMRGDTSWDYTDDRVIIPISLLEDQGKTEEPAPPPEPKETPGPEPKAPKREHPRRVVDAGAPDAESQDAGAVAEAGERKAGQDAGSALAASETQTDGGGPSVKDALSLVGGLKRAVQGTENNVTLVVWFSTIREHPLGAQVGALFSCNVQWRDFMGDLVDPLRDLDGVMVTGPRMADSSKIVALAQHRMEESRVVEVMNTIGARAKRTGSGGPVPTGHEGMVAVRFHADRADRIALTHPTHMIAVTPPEGFEQLRDMRGPLTFPPGRGKAMSATIVNPWRPANKALGTRLPDTLTQVRINISAANDGGVDIEAEFDDQDAALAKAHAALVSEQVRSIGMGVVLTDVEFVAQGSQLKAQTHLSRLSSALVLGFGRGMVCPAGFDGGRGLP